MMRAIRWLVVAAALGAGHGTVPAQPQAPRPAEAFAWDATLKELTAQPGETNLNYLFNLTNILSQEVTITAVRTSCGCTVAKLPPLPWRLEPGASGQIGAVLDVRGKYGILSKTVFVDHRVGTNPPSAPKYLTVRAHLPNPPAASAANAMSDRQRNMMLALADRQAVFKNDCARCHAAPATGKTGKELYVVACGICHESPHRATMVPDLHALKHPADREHWIKWMTMGRAGSLMPAFAHSEGGPLTEAQIDSLADYLEQEMKRPPAGTPHAAAGPVASPPAPAPVPAAVPLRNRVSPISGSPPPPSPPPLPPVPAR